MENIKILAIDDDPVITKQIVDFFDGTEIEGYKIFVKTENDFEKGNKLLQEEDYDILDLYRGNASEQNQDRIGKEILESIKSTVPIAVIFYTGLTKYVEDDTSDMVRAISKTSSNGLKDLQNELEGLIKTGLPLIRKRITTHAHNIIREYYWDVVDNHSDFIKKDKGLLEYLLVRRLAATLNKEGISKIFGKTISTDKIHPLGFYIYPPAQNDFYEMGDILQKNDDHSFHVVLTPSCDLAHQGKAEYILLIPVILLKETSEYKKYVECKKKNTEESLKKLPSLKDSLSKLIGSRKTDRFFFLPYNEFIGMPNIVLDFQQGFNYKLEKNNEYKLPEFKKVAKIDDPFAQDMLAAFIRNKNRPGSPDIDDEHIITLIDSEII